MLDAPLSDRQFATQMRTTTSFCQIQMLSKLCFWHPKKTCPYFFLPHPACKYRPAPAMMASDAYAGLYCLRYWHCGHFASAWFCFKRWGQEIIGTYCIMTGEASKCTLSQNNQPATPPARDQGVYQKFVCVYLSWLGITSKSCKSQICGGWIEVNSLSRCYRAATPPFEMPTFFPQPPT